MSDTATTILALGGRYARELPELSVAWEARSFPDAQLLLLNEQLAADLGLEPDWLAPRAAYAS